MVKPYLHEGLLMSITVFGPKCIILLVSKSKLMCLIHPVKHPDNNEAQSAELASDLFALER